MAHASTTGGLSRAARSLLVCTATLASAFASAATTIEVPSGRFQSFFRVEGRRQESPVPAFRLDAAPVTRAEYLEFVRTHPEWRKSRVTPLLAEDSYLADWHDDLDAGTANERPVTFVSWFAARAYCAAHGERLPSVAEWERVAGADTSRAPRVSGTARQHEPFRFAMGTPVADLEHDSLVVGDVWEWNGDFNSAIVAGSADGRRGSSLFCGDGYRSTNAADYAAFLRYSFRASLRANYTLKNLGFRCAQDLR